MPKSIFLLLITAFHQTDPSLPLQVNRGAADGCPIPEWKDYGQTDACVCV